jgi:hypothetical protein
MEKITAEELVLKIENVLYEYGEMNGDQLLEALGVEFNSNMGDDLLITPMTVEDPDASDAVLKHGSVDALCTFYKDGVFKGMRYWVGMTEVSFGSNTLTRDAKIRTYPLDK